MNLIEAKRTLRKILIRERQSISKTNQKRFSLKIARHVLAHPLLKKAKVIAAFIGFGSEVETFPLVEKLWRMGKIVLAPVTSQGLAQTYFALFRPGDKLIKTSRGPLELARKKKPFNFRQIDFVMVPGLAFDRKGFRLGYGGGVYDRLLVKTPSAKHMGIFFSHQGVRVLPRASFDQKMDFIATENGIIEID